MAMGKLSPEAYEKIRKVLESEGLPSDGIFILNLDKNNGLVVKGTPANEVVKQLSEFTPAEVESITRSYKESKEDWD